MDLFFGCTHKHYSFPISTRPQRPKPRAELATGVYVVCLDCGKEFSYDWHEMKILTPRQAEQLHAHPTGQRSVKQAA